MKTIISRWAARGAVALAACVTWAVSATAVAAFPDRPVRVVVPFGAGSSPDVVMRIVGQKLGERWGHQVVIENRPGASGMIGAAAVSQAKPDGYTLVYTINSVVTINPHLYSKMSYDALNGFSPVSLVVNLGYLLLARRDLGFADVRAMLAHAKARPGELTFSSAGVGSGNHMAMELLTGLAGVELLHVPIPAGSEKAVLGGQVDMVMSPYTTGVGLTQHERMQALGSTLAGRSPQLPDVPALGEIYPGYLAEAWHGLLAPAGTPADVVAKISADVASVLKLPDVRERLLAASLEPVGSTPGAFERKIREDHEKWGAVIKRLGIKLD